MQGANGQLLFHPVAARAGLLALAPFETYGLLDLSHGPRSGERNVRCHREWQWPPAVDNFGSSVMVAAGTANSANGNSGS